MTTDTNLTELEQIKNFTTVVADTADFESIRHRPTQWMQDGLINDAIGVGV